MNSGGYFANKGYTNKQLAMMYYGICVWVRLFMAYTVYNFYDTSFIKILIIIGSLLGVYLNIKGLINQSNSKVWWSRKFHLVISVLIIILICSQLIGIIKNAKPYIVGLLVTDVIGGLIMTVYVKPFQ